MAYTVARSRDEAHLYLDLHPCDGCGSVDTAWEHAPVETDGEPTVSYTGRCEGCGAQRGFLFGLPEREVTGVAFPTFGGREPSRLLDAGEWLWVADLTAGNVPPEPAEARQALATAAAAIEEVIKFIPPGQEEVPEAAFWSDRGRETRADEPSRFQLERLLFIRQTYRELAGRL
ncbi:hypothetical protein [Streptosporangium sp. KLBMP 9127]|nr:hypothetical protein [Streptosporangium sp. KLBMP 9127]